MSYKVSIIIPIFNGEKEIEKCVNSLINQTIGFENIELILIDDKSKDNSREIIQKFSEKYENIIGLYLKENSGGAGKPRNTGIEYATSDYIIFCDVDDRYLEDGIETLYNTISKEKTDVVIGSFIFNYGEGNEVVANYNFNEEMTYLDPNNKEIFNTLSKCRFLGPWAKIFKSSIVKENNIRYIEGMTCDDNHFCLNCYLNSNKIAVIKKPVYIYNVFEDSTIHTYTLKAFYKYLNGTKEVTKLLKKYNINLKYTLSEFAEGYLLILTNLDKEDKKIAMKEIYEFEKSLDTEIEFNKKELTILHKAILNKDFKKAMIILNLYNSLYNNHTIRLLYRKYVNNSK